MNKTNYDWTNFVKRIYIDKDMQEVYDAWTVPEKITEWFLEKVEYTEENDQKRGNDEHIQNEDSFRWKWHNWDFEEEGKILAANGTDRISFTFGTGGNVHVELNKHRMGTELILIQDSIPTDEKSKLDLFVGCATGWTFWLTNLKAWIEHGITLHATGLKMEETSNLVNS